MFAKTLLVGAFAALAAAQSTVLSFTRVPSLVTDGEPQAILYATNDTQTPVTIILRRGASNDLQTIETLTSDSVGGQYIWTPPLSLANGNDYALEIRQAGQNNFFGPFTVQGASPSAVASASSASEATSSSSSVTGSMTTQAANMTSNATMTMTGMTSAGTGTSMSRNQTMSAPTLTNTRTTATDDASATGGSADSSETTSGQGPASTDNAAASDVTGKSTLAFVLGALAAVMYVQ